MRSEIENAAMKRDLGYRARRHRRRMLNPVYAFNYLRARRLLRIAAGAK